MTKFQIGDVVTVRQQYTVNVTDLVIGTITKIIEPWYSDQVYVVKESRSLQIALYKEQELGLG